MAERTFEYGSEDAWSVDCGLQNSLTYPVATLLPSATSGAGVIFTAGSAVFASGDVGKVLRVGGGIATITAYTDTTHIVGTFTRDMEDVIYDGDGDPHATLVASGDWSLTSKISTITGLQHLAGQTVKILGDGNVFPDQTVTAFGGITLTEPCSKVTIGLGFVAQMQTLYLDVGEPTIQGKRKKIAALTTRVHQTRGLEMGSTFSTLAEFKMRNDQPMGQPIDLETGDQRIIMDPSWNIYGQICIQQNYPLPATILGVIPEIVVGDTGR